MGAGNQNARRAGFFKRVSQESVTKVFASGWWGMAKSQEIAILDFAVRVRGFSAMECSAFLCVFA
jgi:hypothetical protein